MDGADGNKSIQSDNNSNIINNGPSTQVNTNLNNGVHETDSKNNQKSQVSTSNSSSCSIPSSLSSIPSSIPSSTPSLLCSIPSSLSTTLTSNTCSSSSTSTSSSSSQSSSLQTNGSCSLIEPKQKLLVKDLSNLIKCHICKGYLIDATTIVECLHSFCKTCIINHLESNTPKSRLCPFCEQQIHKTKPKLNIRSDPTLQDIVYKLVPSLFKNEMERRKEFYSREPESAVGLSSEERGEISGERLIFTPDDIISLSIEYFPQIVSYSLLPFSKCLNNGALNACESSFDKQNPNANQRRFLRCQGGMRVLHLKKWIRLKYDIKDQYDVELLYKHDPLTDDYTMMDLAYIYSWKRNGPLCLYYKIIEKRKRKQDSMIPLPSIVSNKKQTITRRKHKVTKKKSFDYESNLITLNPVNEPLNPVDTRLINSVVNTMNSNGNGNGNENGNGNLNANISGFNNNINGNNINGNNINGNKSKKFIKNKSQLLKSKTIHSKPSLNKKNLISNVMHNNHKSKNNVNGIKKNHVQNLMSNIKVPSSHFTGPNQKPKSHMNHQKRNDGIKKNGFNEISLITNNHLLPKSTSTIPLLPPPLPFQMTNPCLMISSSPRFTASNHSNDNEIALNLCTSKSKI